MVILYDPSDPATRANPYPALARLRHEDPVHWSAQQKSWFVSRYEDVRQVLGGDAMSANRVKPFYAGLPEATRNTLAEAMRYLTLWLVFRDPPEHTRLRRMMQRAFTPPVIQRMRPRIERIIAAQADHLARQETPDLVADFTMPIPALVIMSLMDVPDERLHDIKAWSEDIMLFIGTARATPDKYERTRRGAHEMAEFFRGLIAARRANPSDDALSLLIAARDGGDMLSEDELVATAMLMLFAGHETTTNLMSNASLALMSDGDARGAFQALGTNAATAVEELLRFDGPSNAMGRVVAREHQLGGKTLKVGDRVFAMINAANRDESQFTSPDRLDLARSPNAHMTFGLGTHFCLGAPLARLEAQIALPLLFQRFPAMTQADAPPVWQDSLVMRGLVSLPVRLGRAV